METPQFLICRLNNLSSDRYTELSTTPFRNALSLVLYLVNEQLDSVSCIACLSCDLLRIWEQQIEP